VYYGSAFLKGDILVSGKIAGQVWDLDLPHAEAWVLMAMADHAQHDGTHVFPSQTLIAWKTGYSIRQVRRVQDNLKRRKILIPEGSGYRGVQHYRLDFSTAPLKPPFVTRDTMSSEDKMSSVKKTHVNKLLRTTTDKMSTEEPSTTDKMTAVKMSSEDIYDISGGSTTDIFDTSPIKDARAESLETKATKETKGKENTTPIIPQMDEVTSQPPSGGNVQKAPRVKKAYSDYPGFCELWDLAVIRPGGSKGIKQEALEHWKKLAAETDATLRGQILDAYAYQKTTLKWQEQGGLFVKELQRWLKGKLWEGVTVPQNFNRQAQAYQQDNAPHRYRDGDITAEGTTFSDIGA
jgi:hypothetical protein